LVCWIVVPRENITGYALLAHSVEHFHGKEEVVGSIPTEGS
jgi:hypothetical protein